MHCGQDDGSQREVLSEEVLQTCAAVGERKLLLGLIPTDLSGLPAEFQAERFQLVNTR